jgi:hypothetical protein
MIYVWRETSVCSCNNPVIIPETVYLINFLVELGCKREGQRALLKCHPVHGKTTVPSSKFINLLPHKSFVTCNNRAVSANENPHAFTHPPLTISRLYVCNAAPCCAISFNKIIMTVLNPIIRTKLFSCVHFNKQFRISHYTHHWCGTCNPCHGLSNMTVLHRNH